MKIKTAVIPAGGYGTRFLPSSKCVPKEMFPLAKKPVILHVVEEAVASGIENIIFIVSPEKEAVEHFFSSDETYEKYLIDHGKGDKVKELQDISKLANYTFVYKHPPYGNGGALLAAKHLLEDEPFVLVWSDEIILTKGKPRIKQCLEAYEKINAPIVSAVRIKDKKERSKYGMAKLKDLKITNDDTIKEIVKIVEKPKYGKEPSEYAAHGAYVLTPEIFDAFKKTKLGKNGEMWLTDVLNEMKKKTGLYAKLLPNSVYLDCGDPISYLESQIQYALMTPEYEKIIKKILKRNNS